MRVGVGILGGGTVGGTLARKLLADADVISAKSGIELDLVKVAVRDLGRDRPFPASYATDDLQSVVDDDRVQLVVELMGGVEPARTLILKALAAGKPVVSANKALIAAHGPELFAAAADAGVPLL